MLTALSLALVAKLPAPVLIDAPRTVPGLRPIAMAAAPTGARVLLSLEDGSVRIIDASTRQTLRNLPKHPQPAYGAAWSPDGRMVATGDETARVFVSSVATGAKQREWRVHTRGIQKLSFNANSTRLLSTGKDDMAHIYDLTQAGLKSMRNLAGKGANFYSGVFHPRNTGQFVMGTLTPNVRIYNAGNMAVARQLGGHQGAGGNGAQEVAYNPAGTRVATGGKDGALRMFDATSGRLLGRARVEDAYAGANAVAFSPNGALVAASFTDSTVRVWRANNLSPIARLNGQSNFDAPIAFTADGKWLLTRDAQGSLVVWSVKPAQVATPAPRPSRRR